MQYRDMKLLGTFLMHHSRNVASSADLVEPTSSVSAPAPDSGSLPRFYEPWQRFPELPDHREATLQRRARRQGLLLMALSSAVSVAMISGVLILFHRLI
jgi:hypothetical protein